MYKIIRISKVEIESSTNPNPHMFVAYVYDIPGQRVLRLPITDQVWEDRYRLEDSNGSNYIEKELIKL